MAQSALLAAFLTGLLGGFHCAAMCGGWIAATAGRPGAAPLVPAGMLRQARALRHAGRLATYTVLGALLGAGGGAALAQAMAPAQRVLYVVANVALLMLAVSLARRATAAPVAAERLGLGLFRQVAPPLTRLGRRGAVLGPLAQGALWGLTPCALVYGLLPVALLSGSAVDGAAIMLAFGLGTLPNLLAAQALVGRAGSADRPGWRLVAAVVIAGFAVVGIYRAVFVPEALGSSAYCLVPGLAHGTLAGPAR